MKHVDEAILIFHVPRFSVSEKTPETYEIHFLRSVSRSTSTLYFYT